MRRRIPEQNVPIRNMIGAIWAQTVHTVRVEALPVAR
jgi:hypothetical protein